MEEHWTGSFFSFITSLIPFYASFSRFILIVTLCPPLRLFSPPLLLSVLLRSSEVKVPLLLGLLFPERPGSQNNCEHGSSIKPDNSLCRVRRHKERREEAAGGLVDADKHGCMCVFLTERVALLTVILWKFCCFILEELLHSFAIFLSSTPQMKGEKTH